MTAVAAWDTTIVSRLRPGSRAALYVQEEALAGRTVCVPAPVLSEVAYGFARRGASLARNLRWFQRLARSPLMCVLAYDREAGLLAGKLRALAPQAPAVGRHDRRTKPERRVSWLLDLQIAATAYAAGHDVATDNRRDFEAIAQLLKRDLGLEPLGVYDPPV